MNAQVDHLPAATAQTQQGFPAMLKSFLPEIQRALPKHLNGDRMARIALTAFRRTPALGKCAPQSVFAAVIQASQLGLEPDTLGRAYLIPYGKECQFIPGWKGLVELLNRSGQGTAWTGAVFMGDEFEYMLGDSPFLHHRPGGEYDPEKITHFYAVGRPKGAEWPIIEVWKNERVRKHRDRYNKVGQKHYSYGNWEMYGRKVVLLQVLKYLPASPELATAIEMDYAAEKGPQHLTVNDAIEGTWAPAVEDDAGEGAGASVGTVAPPQAKSANKPAPSAEQPPSQQQGAEPEGEVVPMSASTQNVIRAKMQAAALTDTDLSARFGAKLADLPQSMANAVLAWITNPVPADA